MRHTLFYQYLRICVADSKADSKADNDVDKKEKVSSKEDTAESKDAITLGGIPKIEKYINGTRIEGLQTLYQVTIGTLSGGGGGGGGELRVLLSPFSLAHFFSSTTVFRNIDSLLCTFLH